MGNKMLIDATHPEETRVVVVRGNRIEEFDYESAERKQLKGNIYLAKVTRVEPSLQAAFVDYGGNRHGFLAFSEIHPDYYQIPVADRQALLEEEEEDERQENHDLDNDDAPPTEEADAKAKSAGDGGEADEDDEDNGNGAANDSFDSVGAEDAMEEVPQRQRRHRRSYKIQEVIKRRQVILVQVVKEERGNKGAALTTYLSLAGRYCVLMPNTARGGGISRKITEAGDRKRLKEVARGLKVPQGMGLIVRTAGAKRTKAEIKRDFDYLLRMWESVRDLTLNSTAPSVVYEEGNLIKRSIRDLYNKEIDEILVEGDDAIKEAKGFMKMLMPSHVRNVKHYKETRPLFSSYKVESQLDGLFSPVVTLKSGGYMVMNQTEALVAVDINSGKSTREHNIEDTALRTNLEASEEIARQLRLRDLAGLIVIDFIDMEEKRNNRSVERKLKEALKNDRARIQVGRISHFGLLEMSRQRLRQGMLENSTMQCDQCQGTGLVRSLSSCALSVLRGIEEHLMSRKAENLTVRCDREVAFYILNDKRDHLLSLETTYGISIYLETSSDIKMADYEIVRATGERVSAKTQTPKSVRADSTLTDSDEADTRSARGKRGDSEDGDEQPRKRRRRRGRRGGRRSRERSEEQTAEAGESEATAEMTEAPAEAEASPETAEAAESEAKPKKRARKPRKRTAKAAASESTDAAEVTGEALPEAPDAEPEPQAAETVQAETEGEDEPKPKKRARKPRKSAKKTKVDAVAEEAGSEAAPEPTNGAGTAEPETAAEPDTGPEAAPEPEPEPARSTWNPPAPTATAEGPRKSGWWSKR